MFESVKVPLSKELNACLNREDPEDSTIKALEILISDLTSRKVKGKRVAKTQPLSPTVEEKQAELEKKMFKE